MRSRSGRGATKAGTPASAGHARSAAPFRPSAEDGVRLLMGKDHRFTAFALAEGGLLRWTQRRPGGADWEGPELFPAPRLTHLSVSQGADGFVHFVGRRVSAEGDSVVVVQATQYQTGRPLTQWRSIGNPYKDPERARSVTGPGAAVGGSGRLHVFVAQAGGAVSMRQEAADGRWSAWRALKGQLAQEGAATVVSESGRIELLVPDTSGRVMRWQQAEPDGEMGRCPNIHIAPVPGTLVGLETAKDRFTYYWADAATGGIFAHRPGSWVVPLGGGAVSGRIEALRVPLDGYDCTVLAHRSLEGDVMLAACATENEAAGLWWAPTGERCAGPPALARDVYGRVVIAMLGADGELRIAGQTAEPGLVMGPSVRV
ncbi:hypothetical protein [Streptomyces sp. NBC_01589]|uniref:hypothetical protein n=1 Tax=unclassified Streptomyces TaxID=2593676 RepID=UPI00386FE012